MTLFWSTNYNWCSADWHCSLSPNYPPSQKVWLSSRKIPLKSKNFTSCYIALWRLIASLNPLLSNWKVHALPPQFPCLPSETGICQSLVCCSVCFCMCVSVGVMGVTFLLFSWSQGTWFPSNQQHIFPGFPCSYSQIVASSSVVNYNLGILELCILNSGSHCVNRNIACHQHFHSSHCLPFFSSSYPCSASWLHLLHLPLAQW